MRTKALLSVAAAIAAGAFTAQAQVYSVNVVGYVNQVMPPTTLVAVANPLDNGTNDLESVLGGMPAKSSAQFWNGSGFDLVTKSTAGWSANSSIPPGLGFFVNSKTAYTNTYVGELVVNPGESVTNSLPPITLVMVGSPLPYAGTLADPNLNLDLPAKSSAQFWNGSGYDLVTKSTAGWSDETRVIGVAEGFFLNSKTAYDWVQTAPAN